MADATTTRYGFVKPEVGASADTWGSKWNQNNDDYDVLLGAITTTGSSNAYVLTTGLSLAAYVTGQSFDIIASFSNSGAVTIAVDGLATKAITKNGTTALVTGDIVSGQAYRITYDGTRFQLIGTTGTGVYQPLDATLTALAALSYTSGTLHLTLTAADTFTLMADTALVHTTGTETVAGAKTFTSALVVSLNSGSLPSASSGTVARLANVNTGTTLFSVEAYGAAPVIEYRRAGGTAASPTALASGDNIGGQRAIGYGATAYSGTRCSINMATGEAWTDSAQGTNIRFSTTSLGAASQTERYRIGDFTSANELGYRDGGPGSVPDTSYNFALTDRGTCTDHSSGSAHTYTVPPNSSVVWPANSILMGCNTGAGTLTIGRGSGVVIRNAAGTDADLSVPQYGYYMLRRVASDVWYGRVY